ncbi:MAG: di-heme oxidoredictase family protein [Methylococcaceae bacterium]|jgi:mono/diheme cytochrome c family protein
MIKLAKYIYPITFALLATPAWATQVAGPDARLGDGPNHHHVNQADLESGAISTKDAIELGRSFFGIEFNKPDGLGDPARPGVNAVGVATGFNRINGPDSTVCAACHGKPFLGGGGDNSVNIFRTFNRADAFDGLPDNIDSNNFSGLNIRNSISIFGDGAKELVASEMTRDLQAIAASAQQQANATNTNVTLNLVSKGIKFGSITALPDGSFDKSAVLGVASDLVVRPFNSGGLVATLRQFVLDASEQHHGIQGQERFGVGFDADGDGVVDELTDGDVTANVLFQAALPVPVQILSNDPAKHAAAKRGDKTFKDIGCASCHTPTLRASTSLFRTTSPLTNGTVSIDLARDGFEPRVKSNQDGSISVDLYSDLKRHDMGAQLADPLLEAERPNKQTFLTLALWGVSDTAPWLHDGRASTLTEAILLHGGEAQASRDTFAALPIKRQNDVIEFLDTLRIAPKNISNLLARPLPHHED